MVGIVDLNTKFTFPEVSDLLKKAETITESCIDRDQVIIGKNFIMDVVRRGEKVKKYSSYDVDKINTLVDYMSSRQIKKIIIQQGLII